MRPARGGLAMPIQDPIDWERPKEWRAVATRYGKTARSTLGVLCLAATVDRLGVAGGQQGPVAAVRQAAGLRPDLGDPE